MTGDELRIATLREHGARGDEIEELLAYTERAFAVSSEDLTRTYPLEDEASVGAWDRYAREAEDAGVFECLRRDLVQLNFPVATGISQSSTYLAATRRGVLDAELQRGPGLQLEEPERLRLFVHSTPAGRIPALVVPSRYDFEAVLQALTRRNEPEPVSPAVGAMIVSGYNNWGRVGEYRAAWEQEHPGEPWRTVGWRGMVPQKHLYQDRFVLLSGGPYSGVPAASLGLNDDEWLETSIAIRLDHECAHYFTRRVFGVMRNALHDELIADFMGMVGAIGRYRADWFLRFMGLEAYPDYRESGRLATYRGEPPLSDGAFRVLQALVQSAATNLEAAQGRVPPRGDLAATARILCTLCELTVEEMADDRGGQRMAEAFSSVEG